MLALIGALSGVLLTNVLTRVTKRAEARQARIENALRCVSLVISSQNFTTWIGMNGQPDAVSEDDVRAVERKMYLANLEHQFQVLREARHALALLVTDGIDVGNSWRTDQQLVNDLEKLYSQLRALV